ncbi:MAG: HEAT repeat domain-containing protein [Planctomycetes bacterium]|nr:HEAT repeat domain-containing protein [Planctomycetota bacterium]
MTQRRKIFWLAGLLVIAGGIGGYCWYWQSHAVDRKVCQLVYEAAGYPDTRTERLLRKMNLDFLLKEKPKSRNWDVIEKEMAATGSVATPELVHLLDDENSKVRFAAIVLLSKVGDVRAFDSLVKALDVDSKYFYDYLHNDEWPEGLSTVRCCMIEALVRLGGTKAIYPLIKAMQNPESLYFVRLTAAETLGNFRDTRVVKALAETMQKDAAAEVRNMCKDSLERIVRQPPEKEIEDVR